MSRVSGKPFPTKLRIPRNLTKSLRNSREQNPLAPLSYILNACSVLSYHLSPRILSKVNKPVGNALMELMELRSGSSNRYRSLRSSYLSTAQAQLTEIFANVCTDRSPVFLIKFVVFSF